MAVIVDTSLWIDALSGRTVIEIERALAAGTMVFSPLVVAELLSGDLTAGQRATIGELLQDYGLHRTPLGHWIDVGNLRRLLRGKGINATLPDAHVAQCALDLNATLLTRDDIFLRIAEHTPLRLV